MLVTEKGRVGDKKTTMAWGGGRGLDGKTLGEGFVRDSLKGKKSQPFWHLLHLAMEANAGESFQMQNTI